jgi:hypothetical protein
MAAVQLWDPAELPFLWDHTGHPTERPSFLSKNVIDFFNEANLGQMYVFPPVGVKHPIPEDFMAGDIKDALFFLDREIEGGPNSTYGIVSVIIVRLLIKTYLAANEIPEKYILDDPLIKKYFGDDIEGDHEVNKYNLLVILNPRNYVSPLSSPQNKEINEFVDIFDAANATDAQIIQFREYVKEVTLLRAASTGNKGKPAGYEIPYIEIACRLVGGGCEENLDPIYNANPLLFINALLNNLHQDLSRSEMAGKKAKRYLELMTRRAPKTKFAGFQG